MRLHTLRIDGYFDAVTGYGRQNCALVEALDSIKYVTIKVQAKHRSERHQPLAAAVKLNLVEPDDTEPQVIIQPPSHHQRHWPATFVWITSWEATNLAPAWVENLNKAQAVITFSDWNASCFAASGVTVPIYKVPWFCPPGLIEAEFKPHKELVFGCAGELSGGQWERKNLQAVIRAFRQAFPRRENVRLKIKTGETDHVETPKDERIEWTPAYLTQAAMQGWYSSIDWFVHASHAEGWGFQPLEAMTVGRPVIACKFGGVAEYFDSSVGLEIPYTYSQAKGAQTGGGLWAEPDVDRLGELMRMAAEHPNILHPLGSNAKRRAAQFDVKKSVDALLPILAAHRVLS